MRNFLMVLACFTSVMFAYGAQYGVNSKRGRDVSERGGGGRDGRGVGGGYGGHIEDAFNGVGTDLDKIIRGAGGVNSGTVFSKIPTTNDGEAVDIDTDKIIDFIDNDGIQVVREGDIYLAEGVSYGIYDDVLYLNAKVWDQKLMRGGCETEIVGLLLKATHQSDDSGKISKFYADRLVAAREGRQTDRTVQADSRIFQ